MTRRAVLSAPCKRLLTKAEAAAYCGVSSPTFDRICPVKPISFGPEVGLHRYDVVALDTWIDCLAQGGTPSLEDVLAGFDDDGESARERR